MQWEKTGRRTWYLSPPPPGHAITIWLRYDNLVQGYVFGCMYIGIGVHHLKADNAQDAKAEALQVVTERMESIVEQLKSL